MMVWRRSWVSVSWELTFDPHDRVTFNSTQKRTTFKDPIISKLFTRIVSLWPYLLVIISIVGLTYESLGGTQ